MPNNLPKVILNFYEVNRSDIAKVGGKGANLGELAQLGVPVPPGFIVSSDAYYYFLDMSNLKAKIQDVLDHTNVENNEELEKASKIIQELFLRAKLPPVVEHEVTKSYSKLSGFSDALVAVRSSATAEDLPDASFAGQQSTYLNIKGKKEVLLALKAAWASLFEPRAIYYRHVKNFDHMKIGIAIPIQKMVQSEVSGIMFTLDPIPNDVSKITIEAVLGLGEAIVSGEVTPDHYVLAKENLTILEKTIATQEWMLVRKQKAKNIEDLNQKVKVTPKWQNAQKLDDRSLVTLANIGRVVESHYGFPQDMEWAIEKGKLWVVQSRPVTTISMSQDDKKFEEKIFEEVKEAQEEQHTVIPHIPEIISHTNVSEQAKVQVPTSEPVSPLLSNMQEVIPPVVPVASIPDMQKEPAMPEQPPVQAAPPVTREVATEAEVKTVPLSEMSTLPVLLSGAPASIGVVTGKVRVIAEFSHMSELLAGEILVTEMTNPTWIPIMKIASAIVTDAGGTTSHAAIVSRELGIPAIVGTQIATRVLKTGETITIDGLKGIIYQGAVVQPEEQVIQSPPPVQATVAQPPVIEEPPVQPVMMTPESAPVPVVEQPIVTPVPIMPIVNEAVTPSSSLATTVISPSIARIKTATKVYVNMAEPDLAEQIAAMDVDGVGLLRAEFILASQGIHPQEMIEEKREKDFITYLADNVGKICKAFDGRPVIYRTTDFKTNEYVGLKGGDKFEAKEENPMLGFRGAMRYITNPSVFNLELEAIKQVRNKMGCKNLSVLIPFVRTTEELREVKKLISAADLKRSSTFRITMMVEVPSNVILIDDFLSIGLDGISFGSNDLTQLILGVDRDNAKIQKEFNEKDPALMWAFTRVIESCHRHKVTSSIDGEAASEYPELVEHLVKTGISAVSVNPDSVDKIRRSISDIEKRSYYEETKMIIKDLHAMQVLDSRGNPTIQTSIWLQDGTMGVVSVPAGASKGKYEAREKRDSGSDYAGLGVLQAVKLINTELKDILMGKNAINQFDIDKLLIQTDGTDSKANLGSNTLLSLSLAVLRASAMHLHIPLYTRIHDLYYQLTGVENSYELPTPMFNIINGGVHAGNHLSFQEFMIVPNGIEGYEKKLQAGSEINHHLNSILKQKHYFTGLGGDEGGFAQNLHSPHKILSLFILAVEEAGYQPGKQIQFAIDAASSEFYVRDTYKVTSIDGEYKEELDYKGLADMYKQLCVSFPIFSIEDPFAEDDFEGWKYLRSLFQKEHITTFCIGDDLTVTNTKRLKKVSTLIDGAITKPNQIGTFMETLQFIHALNKEEKMVVISHRSGETPDSTIMDFAVGVNAPYLKSGAPVRGERVAKYNRGLEILETLGKSSNPSHVQIT